MKIAIISKLTPEHPARKHGKRLDVKIFTQLYPGGPQYYCRNGKYCEDMEAVEAFIAEEAPDKISDERTNRRLEDETRRSVKFIASN